MTTGDAWALAMSVEKWIERWMTHHRVPAGYRVDVRNAVMLGLVERADRWRPDLGNWMTFATPWIRALVSRERRRCEREFGYVEPRRPLPVRRGSDEIDLDDTPAHTLPADVAMHERARDRMVAYAKLRLRARERVVVELFLAGYMMQEIGAQLGLSHEGARQIYLRAIRRMQSFIADCDGEDDAGALHPRESQWQAPGPASSDDACGMVHARARVS